MWRWTQAWYYTLDEEEDGISVTMFWCRGITVLIASLAVLVAVIFYFSGLWALITFVGTFVGLTLLGWNWPVVIDVIAIPLGWLITPTYYLFKWVGQKVDDYMENE